MKKSLTSIQRAKLKSNKRISAFGSFSGETTKLHKDVANVIGKKKLTIITGARMGPIGKMVDQAMKKGARNISIIVEPWGKKINPNIKGKARNITIKNDSKKGIRPLAGRLGALQTQKVKAYLFLPSEPKTFSGTMLELQSIVNMYTLEPLTNKTVRKPILLIGKEWKPIYEQIRKDYAKSWPKIGRYIRLIKRAEQLEKII